MRNRLRILAAALIALAPASPALAESNIAGNPAPLAAPVWDELASLVSSREEMMASSGKMIDLMVEGMASDPNLVDLELAFPGMFDAFKASLMPIIQTEVEMAHPLYQAELAALYKANLSESETREIVAHFHTPEMQRFRQSLLSQLQPHTTVRDLMASNDISAESLSSDMTLAAGKSVLQMDAGDRIKLAAFFQSPTGKKFNGLTPQKLEIDTRWANYLSPEAERTIEPTVINAMIAHIAKTDARFAGELRDRLEKGKAVGH